MFDIICPYCGESYIARSVVFDISLQINRIIASKDKKLEKSNVYLKFIAGEDWFRDNRSNINTNINLFCNDNVFTPNTNDMYCCTLNMDSIIDKMAESCADNFQLFGKSKEDIKNIIQDVIKYKDNSNNYDFIYQSCFGNTTNENNTTPDEGEKVIINKIFDVIIDIDMKLLVRISCNGNDIDSVPKNLFIIDNITNNCVLIHKSCPCCGKHLHDDFGCYHEIPVVLLGTHYSGKTSYICALYKFLCDNAGNGFMLLNSNDEIITLNDLLIKFNNGEAVGKTDPTKNEIPRLCFKYKDTVYVFADWPGEMFYKDDMAVENYRQIINDFVSKSGMIIKRANHFMLFIEPTQLSNNIGEKKENADAPINILVDQFDLHYGFTMSKVKSINVLLNKIDILLKDPAYNRIYNVIRGENGQLAPNDIYDFKINSRVERNDFKWDNIVISPTQNTNSVTALNNLTELCSLMNRYKENGSTVNYFPCAPYGFDPENSKTTHPTKLTHPIPIGVELPLINILMIDELI